MRPTRLRLTNFLSFEKLDYSFQEGPVLLLGENRSDEGQESNGSGKTAIQSAIEKCWLDYTSRKQVRDVALIRRGCTEAIIESWIHCPIREQELYIKRTLTKTGNKLSLCVNDEPVKFATVADGNNFIIDWIGISKEDLSNYYVINKKRFISFFSSSNTQKLQLLGRFSNTDFLDNVDVDIKTGISAKEKAIQSTKEQKASIEGRISLIGQQIAEFTEEKFLKEKETRLERKKEAIAKLFDDLTNVDEEKKKILHEQTEKTAYISTLQKNLLSVESELADARKQYEDLSALLDKKNSELDSERSKESGERAKIKEHQDAILVINEALAEINTKLAGMITCPKCGYKFLLDENSDVDDEQRKKADVLKLKERAEKSIVNLKASFQKVLDVIKMRAEEVSSSEKEASLAQQKIFSITNNLNEINLDLKKQLFGVEFFESRIKSYDEKRTELEEEIDIEQKKLKEISEEVFDQDNAQLKDFNQKLVEEQKSLDLIQETLMAQDQALNDDREWLIQYREFRMYLANISIKEIQCSCNETLKEMDSEMRVSIDAFKQLANGTIKDEITATIIRDEALPFDSFSGGEEGRLEYSMILALQKMINKTNAYGGMDFLFTDEIAEGIDALGLRLLIKSFKKFNFPILITTHVVNQSVGASTVKVIKENGKSRIEI